jgi:ribosomal protein L39E
MGRENSRTGGLIARRLKMADYENLMNLVEEVRGLVAYDELEEYKGLAAVRLSEYLENQLDELPELQQEGFKPKKHNPFRGLARGKKKIGPAEVPGHKPTARERKNYWTCVKKGDKEYLCTHGTGKKRVRKWVTIDKSNKNTYNKAYRKWRAANSDHFVQRGFKKYVAAAKKAAGKKK